VVVEHVTLLVNSKTLSKSALKMTVKALKSPAYALNKIRSQSMDFRTQHINQQSPSFWVLYKILQRAILPRGNPFCENA
jgi:hypothetical protein